MEPSRSLPAGKYILAVVLVAAVAGFFYYDLDRYLSFEALKTHRDALLALTATNYGTAVAVFIISYALITGVSLP
ncbi:MAG: TVP38/TMEM64 family protein, partial [Candidatus Binatia bacterium]